MNAVLGHQARQSIDKQVMWTRLISVVEEQAQALLRTAFGSVVREAGDLSAGVYDLKGQMLAQAVTGTPGHVNTMAMAVGHFLDRFPSETMKPGDVFVTNDPWMGTGHLFDYVMLTQLFVARIQLLFLPRPAMSPMSAGAGLRPMPLQCSRKGCLFPIFGFDQRAH